MDNTIRPIKISYDIFGFSDATVLFELGDTKVLCNVTLQNGVPQFLRGKNVGWLTAEYAMLPSATKKRSNRESSQVFRNSRSVEISRLIGRSFRSIVDLSSIGESTIQIDCEVLQADGGTRVACITGTSLACMLAEKRWLKAKIIEQPIFKESVAAISAGIVDNKIILDLDYEHDEKACADFNFVLTQSGKIIEIQGTAEKEPVSFEKFSMLQEKALQGVKQIFEQCDTFFYNVDTRIVTFKKQQKKKTSSQKKIPQKAPLFSLMNRQM